MSHTLHRQGSSESLHHDFVVLSRATRGINRDGSQAKFQNYIKLAFNHNPVNIGNRKAGMLLTASEEELIRRTEEGASDNAVFADPQDVAGFIKDLQAIDYDLSVVCSGPESDVREICEECGLTLHSANLSLGVFGRTDLLPSSDILEITTMCGHHMLSPLYVQDMVDKIRRGRITIDDAANALTLPCPCACINTLRVKEVLERIITSK